MLQNRQIKVVFGLQMVRPLQDVYTERRSFTIVRHNNIKDNILVGGYRVKFKTEKT